MMKQCGLSLLVLVMSAMVSVRRYCQIRWMKIVSSGDLLDAVYESHASNHIV